MKALLTILLLAGTIASAHAEDAKPFAIDKLLESLEQRTPEQKEADQRAKAELEQKVYAYRNSLWSGLPSAQRIEIMRWCYVQAGGVDGGREMIDATKQADCIDRQIAGVVRLRDYEAAVLGGK